MQRRVVYLKTHTDIFFPDGGNLGVTLTENGGKSKTVKLSLMANEYGVEITIVNKNVTALIPYTNIAMLQFAPEPLAKVA